MFLSYQPAILPPSLSARRAWIEIRQGPEGDVEAFVALRKESVDRNGMEINGVSYDVVALRKESVDRNFVQSVTYT